MKKLNNDQIDMRLQFFAEDGDTDQDNGGEDVDTDADEKDSGEEEKTFTQEDLDKAIEKRLARERRKWQKGKENNKEENETDNKEVDKELQAKAERADELETKILCYEQGVDKDSVDDVVALAKAYTNDDTDIEDAIEKVLKKYPQFKAGEQEEEKTASWGKRQKGTSKKLSGVEERFQQINPDIKL